MTDFLLPGEEDRALGLTAPIPTPSGVKAPSINYLLPNEVPAAQAAEPVVRQAVRVKPEQAAETSRLSNIMSLPRDVVERNLDLIRQESRTQDITRIARQSPILARQLTDPNFAKLAHDDVEQLSAIERTVLGTIGDVGVTAVKGAVGLPQAVVGLTDILALGNVGKALDSVGFRFNDAQKLLSTWYSPAQQRANKEVSAADGFVETIVAAIQNPSVIATTVGESLPQMLGGMGVARGFMSMFPKLTPLAAAAIGEGVIAAGSAAEQIRAQTADELLSVKQSLSSLGSGAMTAVFGAIGGKAAQRLGIDDLDTVLARGSFDRAAVETVKKGFVRRMAEGGVSEGVFEELPQSAQEQMWQNFATDKPITEGVGNAAALGLLAGMVTGGAFNSLAGTQKNLADRATGAQQNLQHLADLMQKSDQAQTRVRDVDAFQNYLRDLGEDSGSNEVFLDPRALQQSGVDLNALAQALPSVGEQAAEALTTGRDIVIPRDEFFARLPGTGFEQAILPHVRASQDALSAKEAEQELAQAATFMQAETEKLMAQTQADDVSRASQQAVEQDLMRQFKEANRFTDDVAQVYAKYTSALFGTLAARMNKAGKNTTAEEQYRKFALGVRAESVDGQQQLDQLRQQAGWTEQRVDRLLKLYAVAHQPNRGQAYAVWMSPKEFLGLTASQADEAAIAVETSPLDAQRLADEVQEIFLDVDPDNGLFKATSHEGRHRMTALARAGVERVPVVVNLGSRNRGELPPSLNTIITPQRGAQRGANFGSAIPINYENRDALVAMGEQSQVMFQSASLRRGTETLKRFGLDPTKKHTTRQVAAALEARQREKYGSVARDDRSPETARKLAKWMVEEILFEAENPGASGVGWYSTKFQAALDTMAQEFPELATDQNARDLMTALIAVTSDGQKVNENFLMAADAYAAFKETGKFVPKRGHARGETIQGHLDKVQKLYDELGAEGMKKFLLREVTVAEINALARINGGKTTSDYTADTKLPVAATVFGPKLGAFYANLMGSHGYLTMDRWWSRTFNRYRGILITQPTRQGLDRFKQLIGKPQVSDDEAIAETVPYVKAYASRDYKNGSEIEKAANTLYKAAFDNLEDAPFNASDRKFMAQTAKYAQQNLKRRGIEMSIADIQATLWYYEKRLYGELGARQSADVSYADAARRVVAARSGVGDAGSVSAADSGGDAAAGVQPGDEVFGDVGANILNQPAVDDLDPRLATAVNPPRPAKRADFTRTGIKDILSRSDWVIMTAENPDAVQLDEAANAARMDQLKARLKELGAEFVPVQGKYGDNEENSLVITGISQRDAVALGVEFGQQSVLTRAGLVYKDGSINPARSVNLFDKAPDNYFTKLPDGSTFSIDIDFDHRWPAQSGRVGEVTVAGVHFSPKQISRLDPGRYGTGMLGAERTGVMSSQDKRLKKRGHFYVNTGNGIHPEIGVGSEAHVARLMNLYDVDADPMHIWKGGESAVLDAGFSGYFTRSFNNQGAAVIFGEPVEVSHVGSGAAASALVQNIVVPPAQRTENRVVAIEFIKDQRLPSGQMTGREWLDTLKRVAPEYLEKLPETLFDAANVPVYRDELVKSFYQPAYHGSPHEVDRFSTDFIGTGEGAQAYGWGLYFAENPEVAKGYHRKLGGSQMEYVRNGEIVSDPDQRSAIMDAEQWLSMQQGDTAKAIALAEDIVAKESTAAHIKKMFARRAEIIREIETGALTEEAFSRGGVYQVDIPDEAVARMLNWDKPLTQQPPSVREAIKRFDGRILARLNRQDYAHAALYEKGRYTGAGVYELLVDILGGKKEASEALLAAGIPGIRYLDAASRNAGDGTRNLVVFDDKIVTLTHKNGEPVTQAERDAYFQPQGASARGQITFGNDITQVPSIVTLLKNADLSTYLHELGHFYLEVLSHVASQQDAPAEIVDDMNKVLAWFGIKGDEAVEGGVAGGELGQGPIESAAFKKWFGDSKVVDAEGKPLVVYHGTTSPVDFTDFTKGGWFTADPEYASGYAIGEHARVIPVYLNISNPVDPSKAFDEAEAAGILDDDAQIAWVKKNYDGYIIRKKGMGVVYVPFKPTQIKSAIGNDGTFDSTDPNILSQGGDQGTEGPLPAGRTPLDVWRAMSLEEKRLYHERFARGFEAYLFEGKAPSTELNGAFSRLRAWMVNVYKQITSLNVQLTDEVRGVFNRMIATDEQIAEAEAMRGYAPLFKSAEEMGATPEEWAKYQTLHSDATENAAEQLQARSLRDMQWLTNARGRTLRKLQRDASSKRDAIEEEVRAEVRQEPVYAAQHWLKYGVLPDGTKTVGAKLDLKALKEMYGDGPAAPWRYLATGERGLAGNEGIHPDQAAPLFGFTSGDALVKALLAAEPEATLIEGMTDRRMLERYGDLSTPAGLERAANEAIHNEARGRFIATELAALQKSLGKHRTLVKAAKDFASTLIERKKIKDIKPSQFANAEGRAAKAAERAKSLQEKATEKRNQLVNHYASRAANDAVDFVEKQLKYLRKFDNDGTRESIDQEYLDQIDQILEKVELRRVSENTLKKRAGLLEWIEKQESMGLDPVIDRALVEQARQINYREMPLEDFRGLVDSIRNIEHLGRLKQKLLTAKDQRELAAVVEEMRASIVDNANREAKVRIEQGRGLDRVGKMARGFVAMHRKFASIAREMDGGKDGGRMWERLVRPMNEAGDKEVTMRAEVTQKLADAFNLLKGVKLTRKEEVLPGVSMTREAQLMVALNWGNEGNRQRVLDGGLDGRKRMTQAQAEAILARLSSKEWDFVERIWEIVGSYRPQIAEQEKRLTGIEPKWVEPISFTLPDGRVVKGGYFPAKYDADLSTRSNELEAVTDLRQQMKGAAGRAATRNSYTKARSEEVKDRPLRKDFGVITQHLGEVVHRLSWQDWLIDARRMLNAKPVDSAIREHYGPEILREMKAQLTDIAAGDLGAQTDLDRILSHVRSGVTIAGMGWNLTTGLMQPLGATQSIVRIGAVPFAKGLAHFAANPIESAKQAREKSKFLATRALQLNRDFSDILNRIDKEKLSRVEESYFWFIYKFQTAVDMPTWWGEYEKQIEAGNDESRAVALADQAVIDSQGGGHLKDQARIQRGGAGQKLFTAFYSYFNTTYNLAVEQGRTAGVKGGAATPKLASDYLLLLVIPALAGALLKMLIKGEDDEDKIVKKLIAEQLNYLFGTMVLLREIGGGISAAIDGFNYTGPASLRFFGEIAKLAKQAEQGEIDAAALKAANNVAGIVLHYPAGQVQRAVEGAAALADGDTQNPAALLFGPPKE